MYYRKYHNTPTIINGITFDSKKESLRYKDLLLLERAGKIKHLILQPKFLLQGGFTYNGKKERAITYIADFQYLDIKLDKLVIEDCKGMKTEIYKIKRKLFLYKNPHNIFREI